MPSSRSSATLVAASLLLLGGCSSLELTDYSNEEISRAPTSEKASTADAQEQSITRPDALDLPPRNGRRALPPLEFPQVDIASFPVDAEGETASEQGQTSNYDNDLWARLRSGFRLSNLDDQPERVAQFEKWYAKHPKYFDRLADRAYWFLPYVIEQVEARGMPHEVAILPAIESAFRPDATSRSKAAGMWQFIGSTGRRFGLRQDWWMDARRDLVQSTRAALDYLEYLSEEFDGDWELALAAYNAGEGGIGKAIRRNRKQQLPTEYVYLKLRKETSEYVPRLFAVRNILNDPAKFGITLKPLENQQTVRVLDLKTQTDISVAASFLSLSRKQLHFLNLGYKRGVTPPNGPHTLVVPEEEADSLLAELGNLNQTQRMQWAHHKVRKGEVLGQIASTHGVSVQSIRRANSLKNNTIHIGQELKIPLTNAPLQYAGPALKSDDPAPETHLVARGDSLWKIAQRYGLKLSTLLRQNQMSSKTTLHPGQSLIIRP